MGIVPRRSKNCTKEKQIWKLYQGKTKLGIVPMKSKYDNCTKEKQKLKFYQGGAKIKVVPRRSKDITKEKQPR